MRRIANTIELRSELLRILGYAGTNKPSRARIAAELNRLSLRLAEDAKGMWFPEMKHKQLGLEMSQWAVGHDAVQVVCSNIIAKRAIPKQALLEAADKLESYVDDAKAGKHGWTKADHKSLLKMIKQLRKEHDDVEDGD